MTPYEEFIRKEVLDDGSILYLITFNPHNRIGYADALILFEDELQKQFNLKIDLTQVKSRRNGRHKLIGLEYRVS